MSLFNKLGKNHDQDEPLEEDSELLDFFKEGEDTGEDMTVDEAPTAVVSTEEVNTAAVSEGDEIPAEETSAEDTPAESESMEETPVEDAPEEENESADKEAAAAAAADEVDFDDSLEEDTEPEAPTARDKARKIITNSILAVCGIVLVVCLTMIGWNLYSKFKGEQIYDSSEVDDIINSTKGGLASLNKNDSASNINDLSQIAGGSDVVDPPVTNPDDPGNPENPGTNPENPGTNPENPGTNPENPGTNPDEPTDLQLQMEKMKTYLSGLIKKNSDIFAYIYVDGTDIKYPIVRGQDNDFYLNHDAYTKGPLAVGAIFIDYRLSTDLSQNYNTVIYGHNMDNGSMFHDVTDFKDASVFKNKEIYIYTMDGLYIYKPFCYYKPHKASGYTKISFSTGDTFAQFAQELQTLSWTASNHTFTRNDRIITLSTCLNSTTTSDYRFVLHAYLAKVVK